jgi:6-pyruvoyltetrahydropterin/6-carboxytetrahydropterin synthase
MTGFSCAFRQWRAESHCRFNHGYDLSFKFIFASRELDIRNWAVDFGSLKSLKAILEDAFDHKTVIAKDDPLLEYYKEGAKLGAHQLRILPKSGCEAFAYYVFEITEIWLRDNGYYPRCWVKSVEVRENASNSAIYEREDGPSLSDRMGKLLTTKMEDCDADVERRTGRTT